MVAIQPRPQAGQQHLSALADGELGPDEAQRAIARLLDDPAERERWLLYHVGADALRFPSPFAIDDRAFMAGFAERFAAEPVHLPSAALRQRAAKARSVRRVWRRYGMPGAAMAAAVAAVTWMTYPYLSERVQDHGLMAAQDANRRAAAGSLPQDYLLAHQQFAPSSRLHGVAPYVRTASADAPAPSAGAFRAARP